MKTNRKALAYTAEESKSQNGCVALIAAPHRRVGRRDFRKTCFEFLWPSPLCSWVFWVLASAGFSSETSLSKQISGSWESEQAYALLSSIILFFEPRRRGVTRPRKGEKVKNLERSPRVDERIRLSELRIPRHLCSLSVSAVPAEGVGEGESTHALGSILCRVRPLRFLDRRPRRPCLLSSRWIRDLCFLRVPSSRIHRGDVVG